RRHTVEPAVARLNHTTRRVRTVAVPAAEVMEHGEGAVSGHTKDDAHSGMAAAIRRPVELPVCRLYQTGVRRGAIGVDEIVDLRERTVGRDPEDCPLIRSPALNGRADERAIARSR